ncbi:HesB/YadR/YfhF family protein [Niallia sp. XMNu-256]|uniref:HesB/YadR/YfhF family protein n=1 Tax=Niallia sp. XMNu-256 TaxID=3082444 RepID=UPI0030D0A210
MKIEMSDKVFQWYKEELALNRGDCIRFYIRYGGFNSFVKGFSLGMNKDLPEQSHTKIEKDGITFYIEDCDTWYFDNKDLVVKFNEKLGEPEFLQAV